MDTAKLFKNGNSLAVRLPKKYALKDKEVFIKRVGRVVVLVPKDAPWETFWDSLDMFSKDFMDTRDQLALQKREPL